MAKIRLENLTIGELKHLEKETGVPIQNLGDLFTDKNTSYLSAMSALAFIALRRNGNPTPSDEDTDDVTMDDITGWFELGDEAGE